MNTKAELEKALREAMKSGDELRKRTLRQTLAAIRQVEIDKGIVLDEAGLQAILQKEVKSYQETYEESLGAGRTDLAEKAQAEMEVVQGYLPKQLTQAELEDLVRQAISESGATGLREMGKVMKIVIPLLQGRATGDQASQLVKKFLAE